MASSAGLQEGVKWAVTVTSRVTLSTSAWLTRILAGQAALGSPLGPASMSISSPLPASLSLTSYKELEIPQVMVPFLQLIFHVSFLYSQDKFCGFQSRNFSWRDPPFKAGLPCSSRASLFGGVVRGAGRRRTGITGAAKGAEKAEARRGLLASWSLQGQRQLTLQ